MIKRSIVAAFRDIFHNKLYSTISIAGLSIGLAIFVTGLLYINHELSYEKSFSNYQSIYRVEMREKDGSQVPVTPAASVDAYKADAAILCLATYYRMPLNQPLLKYKTQDKTLYLDDFCEVSANFFNVFDYPIIFGSRSILLNAPDAMVISKTVALRLFGKLNPVGQQVVAGYESFRISGVFDDTRVVTHLPIQAAVLSRHLVPADKNNWLNVYVRTKAGTNAATLGARLTDTYYKTYAGPESRKVNSEFVILRPVADIYLHAQSPQEISKGGNLTLLWLVGCLVTFMLFVALINFINFMIVAAPKKMRENAIKKMLGSSTANILRQSYFEILLRCVLALVFAALILLALRPWIQTMLPNAAFSLSNINSSLFAELFSLLIGMVFVGGTYPIFRSVFFNKVQVLKGGIVSGRKSNSVRNLLIVAQLSVTALFVIGFLIISDQVSFLKHQSLGFKPDNVMVINPGDFSTTYKYESIKTELEKIPGVRHVAYSSGYGKHSDKFTIRAIYNGTTFESQYMSVDVEFIDVMHARFLRGRNFSAVHADSLCELVVNAKLAASLNIANASLPLTVQFFGRKQSIVGIVENLNFYGFEEDVAPMMFTTNKFTLTPYILADIDTRRVVSCVKSIDRLWKQVEPGYPLRFQFLDATFQQLYSTYDGLSKVFDLFTICAVLIAFSGLFGIVATVTLQRTKEIAIRKVLGATVMQILQWLNREFLALVILAGIISFPIAYYLSVKWLNNFAFRISIPLYPFIVAIVALTILTLLTVCAEALKKAMGNPVDALKHE